MCSTPSPFGIKANDPLSTPSKFPPTTTLTSPAERAVNETTLKTYARQQRARHSKEQILSKTTQGTSLPQMRRYRTAVRGHRDMRGNAKPRPVPTRRLGTSATARDNTRHANTSKDTVSYGSTGSSGQARQRITEVSAHTTIRDKRGDATTRSALT